MRLFLAPMEGVIDHHFRSIYSAIGGVDIFVTEFMRVNDTPLTDKTFLRDCPELSQAQPEPASASEKIKSSTSNGTPVRIQLLGSNPATLAQSAHTAALLGASAIDLNCG